MGWRPGYDADDERDAPVLRRVVNTPTPPAPPDVVDEETGVTLPAAPVSDPCQLCGGPLGYGDVQTPLRCLECGQEPPAPPRREWGAA